jgi:hypothetical protein
MSPSEKATKKTLTRMVFVTEEHAGPIRLRGTDRGLPKATPRV